MFFWTWYGFSQVGMITHKDQTFNNILLVGVGIRCCKFRTTWSSSRRAPGLFEGRTKANLGSLLCIRLHGVPQEGCVNLKGCDKSANLCHLVLQHGGVEILWRVCICVWVWTICHAWDKWQCMRLCYIKTSNDLFFKVRPHGVVLAKSRNLAFFFKKPKLFFLYPKKKKVMEALDIYSYIIYIYIWLYMYYYVLSNVLPV